MGKNRLNYIDCTVESISRKSSRRETSPYLFGFCFFFFSGIFIIGEIVVVAGARVRSVRGGDRIAVTVSRWTAVLAGPDGRHENLIVTAVITTKIIDYNSRKQLERLWRQHFWDEQGHNIRRLP